MLLTLFRQWQNYEVKESMRKKMEIFLTNQSCKFKAAVATAAAVVVAAAAVVVVVVLVLLVVAVANTEVV